MIHDVDRGVSLVIFLKSTAESDAVAWPCLLLFAPIGAAWLPVQVVESDWELLELLSRMGPLSHCMAEMRAGWQKP